MVQSFVNLSPSRSRSVLFDSPDIRLGEDGPIRVCPRVVGRGLQARLDIELGESGSVGASIASTARPVVGVAVLLLLLATGACLGLSTNLAKLAGDSGLAPLAFLAWSVAGASLLLFGRAAARGELPPMNRRTIEYFVLSAFVTVAASNLIFVSATPEVGAGFVAPAAALPPLLTYVGAVALGMERFHAGRASGVVLALAGAAYIAVVELSLPNAATFWIGLTLLGPVLLAIGNLYRSLRWPSGLSAESLAPGMLGAATVMLLGAGFLPHPAFSLAVPTDRVWPLALVCVQTLVFALQFVLLFQLQKRGGPVFLSLIGSVGALIGVPAAILLLGESPPAGLALGAVLIVAGVALLNTGRGAASSRRETRRQEQASPACTASASSCFEKRIRPEAGTPFTVNAEVPAIATTTAGYRTRKEPWSRLRQAA